MDNVQAYYESLVDMFATEGWRALMEDMTAGAEIVNLDSCTTTDDFLRAKGKKEIYDRLLGYEDFIRDGFEAFNAKDI